MSPRPGERHDEPDAAHILEWVDSKWNPVCPTDDVPMTCHDGQGWLTCGVCGRRAVDAVRQR